MAGERKRKISLFDVPPDPALSARQKTEATVDLAALGINPYTGRPYSARYLEILAKRRTLPVWLQKQEFVDLMLKEQIIVLVGETGSGKTTQV